MSGSEPSSRRRSACGDASLRAEIDRVKRMTVEERIKAALTMRERFDWLLPVPEPGQRVSTDK